MTASTYLQFPHTVEQNERIKILVATQRTLPRQKGEKEATVVGMWRSSFNSYTTSILHTKILCVPSIPYRQNYFGIPGHVDRGRDNNVTEAKTKLPAT